MLHFLRRIIERLSSGRDGRHASIDAASAVFPRLYDSQLENRRVLNGAPMAMAGDLTHLVIDAGSDRGDGQADSFEIRSVNDTAGSQLQILVNDRTVWQGDTSQLGSIEIQGSSDQDIVTVDSSIAWSGSIRVTGDTSGSTTQPDSITIVSTHLQNFQQIQSRWDSGGWVRSYYASAGVQTLQIEAQGIEVITDYSSAQLQTLEIVGANETWTVADTAGSSNGVSTLHSIYSQSSLLVFADSEAIQVDFRSATQDAHLQIQDLRSNASSIEVRGVSMSVQGTISAAPSGSVLLDSGSTGTLSIRGTIDVDGSGKSSVGGSPVDAIYGGTVTLLGRHVELTNGARVYASGRLGGGNIFIGGGEQGNLLSESNAETVFISGDSILEADAKDRGSGGKIILWSEEHTRIDGSGNLRARGGQLGGNGGFIETSSRGWIQMVNPVLLTAASGRGGRWLIDPKTIHIVDVLGTESSTDTYVLASTVVSQLNSGVSVYSATTGASGDGDILISAAINFTGANDATLSLTATRHITVTAGGSISGNNKLTLEWVAGGNINTTAGSLTNLRAATLTASSGSISLGSVSIGDGAGLTGAAFQTQSQTLSASNAITSAGGDIQITATQTTGTSVSLAGVSTSSGDLEIRADSTVAFTGGASSIASTSGRLTLRGTSNATAIGIGTGAAGGFKMSDASIAAIGNGFTSGLFVGATGQSGNIAFSGANQLHANSITVVADGGADVLISTNVRLTDVGDDFSIQGNAATLVTLTGSLQTDGGDVSVTAGDLRVDGGSDREIRTGGGTSTTGGKIDLGAVTRIDGVNGPAKLSLLSTATTVGGDVTVGAVVNVASGLNSLVIQSSGTTTGDGIVRLNAVRLVAKSNTPATLVVNNADATPNSVILNGDLDLSESASGKTGGSIDFGTAMLVPTGSSGTLQILTNNTSGNVTNNGSDGGDIRLGGIGGNTGNYFDKVIVHSRGAGNLNSHGRIFFQGTGTPGVFVDGENGGNADTVGIDIRGEVQLNSGAAIVLATNPGGIDGLNSSAIDLRNATFSGAGVLSLVTASSTIGNQSNNAGNVFLGNVAMTGANSALVIDTRGTIAGHTELHSPNATTVSLQLNGALDLRNTTIELIHSAAITTTSANTLQVGNVVASGSQDLTLTSQGSVTTGAIELVSGDLSIRIDSDNNSTSSLITYGVIQAASISISGSQTPSINDSVVFVADVTTTVGSITFANLNQVELLANVDLRSADDIVMLGEVGLLRLSGASGTNLIQVQGNDAVLELAPVSGAGAVTLDLKSDYQIRLSSISLANGFVDATIGISTTNTDSHFRAVAIQANRVRVTGSDPSQDLVEFNGVQQIGAGGLSVANVHEIDIQDEIVSEGNVSFSVDPLGNVIVGADITTEGGNIEFLAGKVLIDGDAPRTLTTGGVGGTAASAGHILFADGTTIDGVSKAADLHLDTRGVDHGGSVTLSEVTSIGTGIHSLDIQSEGSIADGVVTLSSIRLVPKTGASAQLLVNQNDTSPTHIVVAGLIDLSSNVPTNAAGSVDFGTAILTPKASDSVLEIRTNHTSVLPFQIGSNGGDVSFGGIANNGAFYFDSVKIDSRGAASANSPGKITLQGSAPLQIAVDGSNGGDANVVGISIAGELVLNSAHSIQLKTNPANVNGLNSTAIDLRNATFSGAGGLSLSTASSVVGNQSNVAGNVRLGNMSLTGAGSSLSSDTRGTTQGRTRLEDLNDTSVSVSVNGDLDFRNTITQLDDSATLTALGDANTLRLGNVVASGAQDLSLRSEGDISVVGVSLTNGDFTVQVDTDSNSTSTFTSSGTISARSISLTGSTTKNDSVVLGGDVTSTVGSISFVSLDIVELKANVDLVSFANIQMTGEVNKVELTGLNGTNLIKAQGSNAVLQLAPVEGTGAVTLDLESDHQILVSSVSLSNGFVDAAIGINTSRTDSSFSATSMVAKGLRVVGNDPANDQVTLSGNTTLGSDGLSVSGAKRFDLLGNLYSAGNVTLDVGTTGIVNLAGDIVTEGTNLQFTAATVQIDGTAARSIATGGVGYSASTGGDVVFNGNTKLAGVTQAASLLVDTRGSSQGGSVTLGEVVGTGAGINSLSIQTSGTAGDGAVSLSAIRLVPIAGTPSQLLVNESDTTPTQIVAEGLIDLSSNLVGGKGGLIDLGSAIIAPKSSSSTLELRTSNTSNSVADNGSDGGDMRLGGVGSNGSNYFDAVKFDSRGSGVLNSSGTIQLQGAAPLLIAVDGVNGGNANLAGITIAGELVLNSSNSITLATNPANVNGLNSRAIDLQSTTYSGAGSLLLTTASSVVGNNSNTAGNVLLGNVALTGAGSSLTIDTRGTTQGRTRLENLLGSGVSVLVNGSLDFRNTILALDESATLTTLGDANTLRLGNVVASGAQGLSLQSEGDISVVGVSLTNGDFTVQVDTDDDSNSTFTSSGTISARSISLTGSTTKDDSVVLGGDVTSTVGSISFVSLDIVELKANVDLVSFANIQMTGEVNKVELTGLNGTNLIKAQGSNAVLQLAHVEGTGAVTLDLESDHQILMSSVSLTNGFVDAAIGINTSRTDSSFSASSMVAKGLRVVGNDPANDQVTLSGNTTLGSDGLSVSGAKRFDLLGNLYSAGNVTLDVGTTGIVNLAGDIVTEGTNLQFTAATVQIDGTAARSIATGGVGYSASTGGNVVFNGNTKLAGVTQAASLLVDTRGSSQGGNVTLGEVVGTGAGINSLSIQTSGTAGDGAVSLSAIRLVPIAGTPSQLLVNESDTTPTQIVAEGLIDLSSNLVGGKGGLIDLGSAIISPKSSSSTLELRTSNTSNSVADNGSDGGDIRLGGVGGNGSNYFDAVKFDSRGSGLLNSSGQIQLQGAAPLLIAVDGANGGNANLAGITIAGELVLNSSNSITLATNPANVNGLNSRAIDLQSATYSGAGGLLLTTASSVVGNNSNTAGNVLLGNVALSGAGSSLTIDTRGTTQGRTRLNDLSDTSVSILVNGGLDFQNTILVLEDGATITTLGDANTLRLGSVVATGTQGLSLQSEGSISTGSISLSAGNLSVQVDTDDDSVSSFNSTGAISAGSATFIGSSLRDDTLTFGADVTTTVGSISFFSGSAVELQADVDLRSAADVQMAGEITTLRLTGASGTNLIKARGANTVLQLAPVTGTGAVTLDLESDHQIWLSSVSLLNGFVDATIGMNTTRTDSLFQSTALQSNGLRVTGTDPDNDRVEFTGTIQTGAAGVEVSNVSILDVRSNVTSAGKIYVHAIETEVSLSNGSTVTGAGVDIRSNVQSIRLVGDFTTYSIRSIGDTNSLELANVQSSEIASLYLDSEGSMTLSNVQLQSGATLDVKVDSDGDTNAATLNAQSLNAGYLSLRGSSQRNDVGTVTGTLTSTSGSIALANWSSLTLGGAVFGQTGVSGSGISNFLRFGEASSVTTANGGIALTNDVNRVDIDSGNTPFAFTSNGGSVQLGAVRSLGANRVVEVRADQDVELSGTDVANKLVLQAGKNGSGVGQIRSTGVQKASAIEFRSASGIGVNAAVQTNTASIDAINTNGGVVRIANTSAVDAHWQADGQSGTNLVLTQSGGRMILDRIVTSTDLTPSAGESDVQINSNNADVVVSGTGIQSGALGSVSIQANGTSHVDVNQNITVTSGTLGVSSGLSIRGSGNLISDSVVMSAGTGIGTLSAMSTQTNLLSATTASGDIDVQNLNAAFLIVDRLQSNSQGSVSLRQTGGGSLFVVQASTGVSGGNVKLENTAGGLYLLGNVVAGGTGDVMLDASSDIYLIAGSRAQTTSESGEFFANAGGGFYLQEGAAIHVGAGNAATEAILHRIPTQVSIKPIANLDGVNVDALGSATLIVQLGPTNPGSIDKNFGIKIDWADGEVDDRPHGITSPLSTFPGVSRFDASGVPFVINHQYLGNPNTNDPAAPIPIIFTLTTDSLQRIHINDSLQTGNLLTQVILVELTVPAAGLFALRLEIPDVQIPVRAVAIVSDAIAPANTIAVASNSVVDLPSSVSDVASKTERRYVLRLVTPINEDGDVRESENIELSESDIADLPGLFKRLGDNRYRIYSVLDSGIELLLRDFYLKRHVPIEMDESSVNELNIPGLGGGESESSTGAEPMGPTSQQQNKVDNADARMQIGEVSEKEAESDAESVAPPLTPAAAGGILGLAGLGRSFRRAARKLRGDSPHPAASVPNNSNSNIPVKRLKA